MAVVSTAKFGLYDSWNVQMLKFGLCLAYIALFWRPFFHDECKVTSVATDYSGT